MSVYFIAAPDTGYVKIGYALNPVGRLSKMQVDSPVGLSLLAAIEGSKVDEKALHVRFSEYRMRGEWFRLEGSLVEYVATLTPWQTTPRAPSLNSRIIAATGISQSYASMVVSNSRKIPLNLAVRILMKTGWRHPMLGEHLIVDLEVVERIDPWIAPSERAAA